VKNSTKITLKSPDDSISNKSDDQEYKQPNLKEIFKLDSDFSSKKSKSNK